MFPAEAYGNYAHIDLHDLNDFPTGPFDQTPHPPCLYGGRARLARRSSRSPSQRFGARPMLLSNCRLSRPHLTSRLVYHVAAGAGACYGPRTRCGPPFENVADARAAVPGQSD